MNDEMHILVGNKARFSIRVGTFLEKRVIQLFKKHYWLLSGHIATLVDSLELFQA
jgi:hypothetical protein